MTTRTVLNALAATGFAGLLWLPAAPAVLAQPAADCSAAARRVVSQTGGRLLSATAVNQGGRTVCQITVLVQDGGNSRPRRMTVTVPQ